MKWWKEDSQLYASFKNELAAFPFLELNLENGKNIIRGLWPVFGESKLITKYSIKIEIPDDYPKSVPLVYELEGKIPRIPDRHINYDNTCCLFAPPERWEQWPLGTGIDVLLSGAVKQFFFSQAYFNRTGEWPFGEWLHGDVGVVQFYFERLNISSIQKLKQLLIAYPYRTPPRGWNCPCGSHRPYEDCHWKYMKPLIDILPEEEWKYLIKVLTGIKS
ncbi:hypothetical protein [Halobacteriovorax sp. HLS]|uniref:hypothetical protein n=1 Tax=Halobacteriovorax sp. HLS TaxID=2234000 RepID=UPI000FDAF474|nr:hypothetical protein [Halobacteriovorax sp. HLS]